MTATSSGSGATSGGAPPAAISVAERRLAEHDHVLDAGLRGGPAATVGERARR